MTHVLDICVPTYDRTDVLNASLKDLHFQINNERTVVVHILDDASTDNTCSITKQYAASNHWNYLGLVDG